MRWVLLITLGTILLYGQQTVERAWRLVADGKRTEAEALLYQVIAKQPGNAEAHLLLGSLLMEAGKKDESIEQLKTGAKLEPHSADAQNALGEALNKFGRTSEAKRAFEKALALKPDFGIAQFNLGQVLLAHGDIEGAAQHLDRAIRLLGRSDDAADAYYLRAKVYMAKNEIEEAAKALEAALQIRPNFAEAWSDLGQARKALLDDAGALDAFKKAVALKPDDAVAQYRLGAELLREDQPEAAIEHLKASYRIKSDDQSTLNALQSALRQAGRTAEADEIRRKLVDLLRERDRQNQNELRAVKLNNEGAELQKTGDLRGALEKYREAVQLYPAHPGMRLNYALALLQTGQWTQGLNELHDALARDPQNEKIRAVLQDALKQAPPGTVPKWE